MLAYVELVQRKEKEIGCDVLTHQKWWASPFGKLANDGRANSGVWLGAVQIILTGSCRLYLQVHQAPPPLEKIQQSILSDSCPICQVLIARYYVFHITMYALSCRYHSSPHTTLKRVRFR